MTWALAERLVAGAGLGTLYFLAVGCRAGTCPITSRWWTSAGYGALMAFLLSRP